jgi:hypothetical protein
MKGPKIHFPRARPPALFRLQGLVTLLTAYALRSRAGSISHRRRSWDSPFGAFSSRKVSGPLPPEWAHLPFHLSVLPPHKAMSRPDKPRLLGFRPFESSWQPGRVLACQPLDAPLGFRLSGPVAESLVRAFTRTPLTRFAGPAITRRAARRLRVSIGLRPASPAIGAEAPALEKRPS